MEIRRQAGALHTPNEMFCPITTARKDGIQLVILSDRPANGKCYASGMLSPREKLLLAAASAKPGRFSKGIPNVEARAVALADPELAKAIAPDTCVLSAKGPSFCRLKKSAIPPKSP